MMRGAFWIGVAVIVLNLAGCTDPPHSSPNAYLPESNEFGSSEMPADQDSVEFGDIDVITMDGKGPAALTELQLHSTNFTGITDSEGYYHFSVVPVGTYVLAATNPSGRSVTGNVTVFANLTVTITLNLESTVGSAYPVGPPWQWGAPTRNHTIRPGVNIGGCTSNFLFYEPIAGDFLIGLAAHCEDKGSVLQDQKCAQMMLTSYWPIGTEIVLPGADHPGTLYYNSKIAMKQNEEDDDNICHANDFSLVRVDPRDHDKVHPEAYWWGGPTKMAARPPIGTLIHSYGYGIGDADTPEGHAKSASITGYSLDGWVVESDGLGQTPGDSGSYIMTDDGSVLAELGGGKTMLDRALPYANDYLGVTIEVVLADQGRLFTQEGAGKNL